MWSCSAPMVSDQSTGMRQFSKLDFSVLLFKWLSCVVFFGFLFWNRNTQLNGRISLRILKVASKQDSCCQLHLFDLNASDKIQKKHLQEQLPEVDSLLSLPSCLTSQPLLLITSSYLVFRRIPKTVRRSNWYTGKFPLPVSPLGNLQSFIFLL